MHKFQNNNLNRKRISKWIKKVNDIKVKWKDYLNSIDRSLNRDLMCIYAFIIIIILLLLLLMKSVYACKYFHFYEVIIKGFFFVICT